MNDDEDRYNDAAGWDGSDNDRIRRTKNTSLSIPDPGFSPFLVTSGTENSKSGGGKPVPQFFGSLWRAGETAVLFGDAGIGKSVLAIQIAESIACGKKLIDSGQRKMENGSGNSPLSIFRSPLPAQKVLYVDFERTREQFGERYSAPSPIPGKLPVSHRLPRNLIRAHLDDIDYIPDVFKNEPHRYFSYWVHQTIEESGARVVIIDNIAYLARTLSGGAGTSVMKTLRLWATRFNLSILAVAHRRDRGRPRPLALADLAAAPTVADLADTVFAIGGSTIAPDLRYIKHLKSRSSLLTHGPDNVVVNRIARMPSARDSGKLVTDNLSGNNSLITANPQSSSNSPLSIIHFPLLGLEHLGFSPESVHLTDHVKQAQLANRHEREQLRRSKSVINTLMSREYKRYLER